MLNNSVKRGELNNISIVLNGFQNKAKYGAGYGYGYGYGNYGNKVYASGYVDEESPKSFFDHLRFRLLKIRNLINYLLYTEVREFILNQTHLQQSSKFRNNQFIMH